MAAHQLHFLWWLFAVLHWPGMLSFVAPALVFFIADTARRRVSESTARCAVATTPDEKLATVVIPFPGYTSKQLTGGVVRLRRTDISLMWHPMTIVLPAARSSFFRAPRRRRGIVGSRVAADAAAATRTFRGDGSRRRRGRDAALPRRGVAANAAAGTCLFRGGDSRGDAGAAADLNTARRPARRRAPTGPPPSSTSSTRETARKARGRARSATSRRGAARSRSTSAGRSSRRWRFGTAPRTRRRAARR